MDDRKTILLYATIFILSTVLFIFLIYSQFFATIDTKVYFSDSQAAYLLPEKREIKKNQLYSNLIQELIAGPNSEDLNQTIPPQTELLGVRVKDNIARVDFSQELMSDHWGGTAGETMTVYSIVNTLTQFNSIDKVQILIAGKKVETLAGHMELNQPISFNSQIIKSE
ncbi:MAG: GerMN domain-containing protein [Bacillota bacterium]